MVKKFPSSEMGADVTGIQLRCAVCPWFKTARGRSHQIVTNVVKMATVSVQLSTPYGM